MPGKGGHWLPPARLQSEHYSGSPFSPLAFFILLIFFTCHLTNKDTSKEGIEPLTVLLLLNRNLEICLVRKKNLLVETNLKDLASSFTTHEWISRSQLLFGKGNWYVVFMTGCVDMCLWEFILNIWQVHRTSLGIYIYSLSHIFSYFLWCNLVEWKENIVLLVAIKYRWLTHNLWVSYMFEKSWNILPWPTYPHVSPRMTIKIVWEIKSSLWTNFEHLELFD